VKCKNCGREIGKGEEHRQLKTEMTRAAPASGPVSAPEGVWMCVYCLDCGLAELKHLEHVNRP
jgi:hypothetical protein